MADSDLLDAALSYAARGWSVFPLHAWTGTSCTCGMECGRDAGKHPRTSKGLHDGTTREGTIRRWWGHQWPDANIGIATGRGSGIVVVDVDEEGLGTALARRLPETVMAITGSGGAHYLFRHPGDVRIPNRQSIAPGIDIRGDGGYIVAPPSRHRSGRLYAWDAALHPADRELAPLPDWLLEMLLRPSVPEPAPRAHGEGEPADPEPVLAGCGWLRHCVADAATLPRDPWYAMLTIATRFRDGERLAHAWSSAYPGYTADETGYQARSARSSPGPRTCVEIRQSLGGEPYCAECVHWGKLRSPLSLSRGALPVLDALAPPPAARNLVGLLDEIALPETVARPFVVATPANGRPVGVAETNGAGELPAADPDGDGQALTLARAREIVKPAVSAAREDPGTVYEPAVLEALALIQRYDAKTWAQTKKLLQRARISLKELFPHFPLVALAKSDRATYGPAASEEIDPDQVQYAGDMLADCPLPTLIVPKPYFLRAGATGRLVESDEGLPQIHTVAPAPVLPSARLRDAVTGEESMVLTWCWAGQPWVNRIVPRSQALSARGLSELAAVGFPSSDHNAKLLVGYLHQTEAVNRRQLPCAAVSSHLGWQGEGGADGFLAGRTLILPDGTMETATELDVDHPETWSEKRVQFHGISEGGSQVADGFHARGTWGGWVEAVRGVQGYPKVILAFYASLTPPLLELFRTPNFIIDWSGATSKGKTSAVRLAASVWGNPDEHAANAAMWSWNVSHVFVERASAVISGLPLILDDTKKARDPKAVAKVIYDVTTGRGRGRGTVRGLARTETWRTVLLSTGEAPATSFTQDGGARTRTLEIRGLPFGAADRETERAVKSLNQALMEHYGHAGPRFVQWLMGERDRWPEWRDYYRAQVETFAQAPPSAEASRLAQYAALITVAGVMAHRALPLPWEHQDPIRSLWTTLALDAAEAAGELRALQDVVSWAYAHEATFHGRMPTDRLGGERQGYSISGRWDAGSEWKTISFLPTVLRGVLRDEGYDYEAIVSGWKERQWLDIGADGKPAKSAYLSDGKSARMVVILRTAIEAVG